MLCILSLFALVMSADPIGDFMRPGARVRVIAHRGFSGVAPENTLAAFQKAIEVNADMFELDVLLSRDGRVVVIHDDTVERTTDGVGSVSALTLAELRALDAGSWFSAEFAGERIPTLEETLELAKDRILVNIEIKTEAVTDQASGGIVDKTLAIVRRADMMDQVVISSFDPRALAHTRKLDPSVKTASLYNAELQEDMAPEQVMEAVGSNGFNLSRRQVDAGIVEACHRLDRPVAVYTVNEIDEMKAMLELGVDAIFTDHPDRLIEVLAGR
jgi:glycerophosphoryl diester phosphodiesterase